MEVECLLKKIESAGLGDLSYSKYWKCFCYMRGKFQKGLEEDQNPVREKKASCDIWALRDPQGTGKRGWVPRYLLKWGLAGATLWVLWASSSSSQRVGKGHICNDYVPSRCLSLLPTASSAPHWCTGRCADAMYLHVMQSLQKISHGKQQIDEF